MSIKFITGDDFMHFDAPTHRTAVGLYDSAVEAQLKLVAATTGQEHQDALDELTNLLQLRKLHKQRLEELEEEQPAPTLASQQFEYNERAAA